MQSSEHILICDDDDLVADVMEFHLSANGYRVSKAEDGQQALDRAAELRPDLIILDAMMPKLNGFETLSSLKADATLKHIPVMMLTARKGERDIARALEGGAQAYLLKPVVPADLLARLSAILSGQP